MRERAPYDLIAERWSQDRSSLFREQPYVDRFLGLAAPGGHILDLGCGVLAEVDDPSSRGHVAVLCRSAAP